MLKQDILSYFCYILNVFTKVFFECFLCVCFCEFFSSNIHFITIQYKTIQKRSAQTFFVCWFCVGIVWALCCSVCVFVTGGHLNNYLLHLRFHCNVSIPVLPLYFLHVPATGSPVILGNCCNGIMSQLYNIRHLKTDISSGDVSFHRCPDQLNRIEVCMVGRESEAVMSILF